MASLPSAASLSYHWTRKRADYAFERSYANLFPGTASTADRYLSTTAADFTAPQRGRTQPRVGLKRAQLVDPVVQQSKFRVPTLSWTSERWTE